MPYIEIKNMLRKQILYVFILSLLSIFIGLIYYKMVPAFFWFSFDFLGPEIGSESSTIHLWGIISISIGGILIILSLITMFKEDIPSKMFMNVSLAGTVLLIILQIPPLFLWLTIGTRGQIVEGLKAAILHAFILLIASKVKTLTINIKSQGLFLDN